MQNLIMHFIFRISNYSYAKNCLPGFAPLSCETIQVNQYTERYHSSFFPRMSSLLSSLHCMKHTPTHTSVQPFSPVNKQKYVSIIRQHIEQTIRSISCHLGDTKHIACLLSYNPYSTSPHIYQSFTLTLGQLFVTLTPLSSCYSN